MSTSSPSTKNNTSIGLIDVVMLIIFFVFVTVVAALVIKFIIGVASILLSLAYGFATLGALIVIAAVILRLTTKRKKS